MYVLDTNAIIYFLKGEDVAVAFFLDIFQKDVPIYISAITEIELFSFQSLSQKEIESIEEVLKTVVTVSVDSRLARLTGFLRRQHRLKIPDSVIAATALLTGSTLVTRNIRDFKHIPNLSVMSV
ncbi:MAG: type II toxin-antitoxin system VapC family toxin [bacterium]|nr:type II toxin-antitoxin system VapC family toxin [bacterium]